MIPWLKDDVPVFPPVAQAMCEPNGLLAAGGKLRVDWLLAAYQRGIFPWFSDGQPLLWWSPDPRMVFQPAALHVSRSLRKLLRKGEITPRVNHDFSAVIHACAAPRKDHAGTWISPAMIDAYLALHVAGHAHSIECWQDNQLVGGVYGVQMGGLFYGESMFSRVPSGSKVALAFLSCLATLGGIDLIDCQMETPHLHSMGARPMPRAQFIQQVALSALKPIGPEVWVAPSNEIFQTWLNEHRA